MSQTLSELLGAIEPLFSLTIRELERVSGQPGQDVRLSAEIIGKVHLKTRELGLDPKDTTGSELYQALLLLTKRHDEFLVHAAGGHDIANVQDVVPRMVSLFTKLKPVGQLWVMKPAAVRKLLKKLPPKRVMKQLKYKSIDSMLKRESVAELLVGVRLLESRAWQEKFVHSYRQLSTSDFESRRLEIIHLDAKRWGTGVETFVRGRHQHVTHLKEMGVIAVLPLPVGQLPGVALSTLLLLLHYANELRLYSTLFKFHQMQPQFGQFVADTIWHDRNSAALIAGQHLHWRVVQRYYGRTRAYSEVFEPHVQADDLLWRQAEDMLYRLEPALKFWQDLDYVGAAQADGRPVSFNLMDMVVNYCNRLPYAKRSTYHLRQALWNELFVRYLSEPMIEQQLIKQLDQHGSLFDVVPVTSASLGEFA